MMSRFGKQLDYKMNQFCSTSRVQLVKPLKMKTSGCQRVKQECEDVMELEAAGQEDLEQDLEEVEEAEEEEVSDLSVMNPEADERAKNSSKLDLRKSQISAMRTLILILISASWNVRARCKAECLGNQQKSP